MDTLTVELTAALVDNPATASARTKVNVTLTNSSGRLSVENLEGSPTSIHRFIVSDVLDVGIGGVNALGPEQGVIILAISCSMTNPRILFSPIRHVELPSSLKKGAAPPPQISVINTPSGIQVTATATVGVTATVTTLLGTQLSLDEVKILDVINRLLALNIFSTPHRSLFEENIVQSIKRYQDALVAPNVLSCYLFMFNALEKAVNADNEVVGDDFDHKACTLTSLVQADIQEIRRFNDRVKHVLRNKGDFATLKAGEAKLTQLALNLKKAVDCAILSRI